MVVNNFNNRWLLAILILATLFISCNDKGDKEESVTKSVEKVDPIDQWKQITEVNQGNDSIAKNPAHGQPGHRCDIPVGAPLNSAANNNTTPVQMNNATAGNTNPAHGQPGHRCDIPVGAPLDSPPANTATSLNTVNGSNTSDLKVNPPHGQAGHRCDIKVGDPLPQG